jgi:hypothetical protein
VRTARWHVILCLLTGRVGVRGFTLHLPALQNCTSLHNVPPLQPRHRAMPSCIHAPQHAQTHLTARLQPDHRSKQQPRRTHLPRHGSKVCKDLFEPKQHRACQPAMHTHNKF